MMDAFARRIDTLVPQNLRRVLAADTALAAFFEATKRPRTHGREVPLLQNRLKRAEEKEEPDQVKD